MIADAYAQLKAIAVTEDSVYFTGCRACDDHYDLYRCPAEGCSTTTSSGIGFTLYTYDEVLLSKSHLYVRESTEAVRGCALADCAGTNARWGHTVFGGELTAIATDGDTVYVKAGALDLRTCPEAVGCAAPATLANSAGIPGSFRVHAGQAYWLEPGPTTGTVRRCNLLNCGGGTTFAVDSYGGTELEVDDTGVYWINPSTGTVRYCPLTGCPLGGAGTLASGRVNPKELTLGAGFVYWIEGNTILKVAKP